MGTSRLECARCGAEFDRPQTRGRRPTYCSVECRRSVEHEKARLDYARTKVLRELAVVGELIERRGHGWAIDTRLRQAERRARELGLEPDLVGTSF